MGKREWVLAELAAYLQALVDAGKGDATVLIVSDRTDTESGLLLNARYTRQDPSDADDSGIVTLTYGDL